MFFNGIILLNARTVQDSLADQQVALDVGQIITRGRGWLIASRELFSRPGRKLRCFFFSCSDCGAGYHGCKLQLVLCSQIIFVFD